MERNSINNCCNAWEDIDLIDINSFIDDVGLANTDDPYAYWNQPQPPQSTGAELDASLTCATSQEKECAEVECPRKRGRVDSCSRLGSKACRERLRREKLNDRFAELCSILEPGRPMKTDKLAILGDAIRILNQLKSEAQEYKEMNEKLSEEIKTLKADKNELREEKLVLKADKERMEQQLKTMALPPPGYMAPHPAAYQPGLNKMPVFPGYSFVPMWQYLPPSARDTSQDHELRPPAA
ncbi:transcription factor bHLH104-like [Coffea arabica]|uniref:Transcription factor bHLH104-like n=1 Tax=Coffea arabica TaxID=13443 RepID=A0ABM4X977_COFAR